MASKKKKNKKTGPRPTVRRGPLPSVASPGDMTPSPAPAFSDQLKKTQAVTERRMSIAGRETYGYPIKMEDAVNTRVKYVEDAIARSGNGVPAGHEWYLQHQEDLRQVTEKANEGATTPVSVGRVINASGPLSIRNNPRSEARAARSAGYIASHPDETVDVTGAMSEATLKIGGKDLAVEKGVHPLRNLSGSQIALLGRAETAVVKGTGEERSLNRGVTSATLDSSGRLAAAKAIDLARGADFDTTIKDGPKIHNYVTQTHLADPKEVAYNKELFWRRANDPMFTEGVPQNPTEGDIEAGTTGPTTWKQGHLMSASEMSGFDPSQGANISVEDYIGHAMSSEVASQKGKKGASARKAQDIVNVKKGRKGILPADLSASEMAHSFHEEATRRAAQRFAYTSPTNEGDVTEAPTPGIGIQPVTWTEWQAQHNPPKEAKPRREKKQPKPPTLFKM